ncbi:MAG: DUF4301 family protein [Clostridia bacterium]|nr:DUF4301 family protein [Clostridia bacterium]
MEQFIRKFEKGTQYVKIVAPVTKNELTDTDEINETYLEKRCVKFIPASGAATRMFKDLYGFVENHTENEFTKYFFEHLSEFAFYEDIKDLIEEQNLNPKDLKDQVTVAQMVLQEPLCYGEKPKALIKMHRYDDKSTTPIDEHIFEGKEYAGKEEVYLHFTISENHETLFKAYVKEALKDEKNVHIEYSFQKKATDTLAVDLDNIPFHLDDDTVLYRAGGHGALIENLNDLDSDIIYIKNVDNVCHQSKVDMTIYAKKKLASIGFEVKKQIDLYMNQLTEGTYDLFQIDQFLKKKLHIDYDFVLTKERAIGFLNRPLRVCGVVKNQGEPGGGPFVVDNGDYRDLQICEMAEIDIKDPNNLSILKASEFFNPVDLVCFVKDFENNKFDLRNFINEERYFISEKSYKGRTLKALEHPGLWNGAMDHWNTLFVEVPLLTFNPVKTVNDLLREGHRK